MRSTPLLKEDSSSCAKVSELGFGCAAIAGRVSRKDSLAGLAAAYEAGVTLFDTARSYGYGESEAVVGEFIKGKRQSVVICTKFGILPAARAGWKQKLKPLARSALKVFPGLRKAVRSQIGDQFLTGQFTVETLKASFHTSLRELGTDYVDMLLMHAAPASAMALEDLLDSMGTLVESGKVRLAGISGDVPVIEQFLVERPAPLATAQFALNLASMALTEKTRRNADLLLVANHPFGGPAGAAGGTAAIAELRRLAELPAGLATQPALKEKLDPEDPQVLPELVLNCILRGTGVAAVIPAMMQPRHIHSNVRAVEQSRFSLDELNWIRGALIGSAH